jgi:hypothetical protein
MVLALLLKNQEVLIAAQNEQYQSISNQNSVPRSYKPLLEVER